MKIIIDNNILFSLMKPDSTNSYLFSVLKLKYYAPEFIKKEFEKYEKECLLKSKLSKKEFEKRKKQVFEKIILIKFSEYKQLIEKSKKFIHDIDDAPYIALALKLNSFIWSNDKELKNQDKVRVLSTKNILEIF